MNEKDAIDSAHDDIVQQLFRTLYEDFAIAAGDKARETAAEAAFARGILLARRVQARALAILP